MMTKHDAKKVKGKFKRKVIAGILTFSLTLGSFMSGLPFNSTKISKAAAETVYKTGSGTETLNDITYSYEVYDTKPGDKKGEFARTNPNVLTIVPSEDENVIYHKKLSYYDKYTGEYNYDVYAEAYLEEYLEANGLKIDDIEKIKLKMNIENLSSHALNFTNIKFTAENHDYHNDDARDNGVIISEQETTKNYMKKSDNTTFVFDFDSPQNQENYSGTGLRLAAELLENNESVSSDTVFEMSWIAIKLKDGVSAGTPVEYPEPENPNAIVPAIGENDSINEIKTKYANLNVTYEEPLLDGGIQRQDALVSANVKDFLEGKGKTIGDVESVKVSIEQKGRLEDAYGNLFKSKDSCLSLQMINVDKSNGEILTRHTKANFFDNPIPSSNQDEAFSDDSIHSYDCIFNLNNVVSSCKANYTGTNIALRVISDSDDIVLSDDGYFRIKSISFRLREEPKAVNEEDVTLKFDSTNFICNMNYNSSGAYANVDIGSLLGSKGVTIKDVKSIKMKMYLSGKNSSYNYSWGKSGGFHYDVTRKSKYQIEFNVYNNKRKNEDKYNNGKIIKEYCYMYDYSDEYPNYAYKHEYEFDLSNIVSEYDLNNNVKKKNKKNYRGENIQIGFEVNSDGLFYFKPDWQDPENCMGSYGIDSIEIVLKDKDNTSATVTPSAAEVTTGSAVTGSAVTGSESDIDDNEENSGSIIITAAEGSGTVADLVALDKVLFEKTDSHIVGIKDSKVFGYDGDVYAVDSKSDTKVPNVTKVILPNTVTEIPENAFRYHPALATVEIEETGTDKQSEMKSIGDSAFEHCDNLTDVTIPSSVESIGKYAFRFCEALTDFKFNAKKADGTIRPLTMEDPAGETHINLFEVGAFYSCSGLRKLVLPSTVTDVDEAFQYSATGLTDVLVLNKSLDLTSSSIGDFRTNNNPLRLYTLYEADDSVEKNKVMDYALNDNSIDHEYLCKEIKISKEPDGKSYYWKDGNDLEEWTMKRYLEDAIDGMEITPVYYSIEEEDGIQAKDTVPVESSMVTGFDLTKIGKYKINILYGRTSTEYELVNYYRLYKESITSNLSDLINKYSDDSDICYTGEEIVFDGIEIRNNNSVLLEEGRDYTINYEDNIDAGMAYIHIVPVEGSIYYGDEFVLDTFRIEKRDLSDEAVTGSAAEVKFSEIADLSEDEKIAKIKKGLKVFFRGKLLDDDEYYVTDIICDKVGKDAGSVTIKAYKNFTGEKTITFDVVGEETSTPTEIPDVPTATPKATPVATSKAMPKSTPKATPKATPKVTPGATPKATPVATSKATPKVTPGATPKATPVATSKATPIAAPKATPVATSKATPVVTPKATPNSKPEATLEVVPKKTPVTTTAPKDDIKPAKTQLPQQGIQPASSPMVQLTAVSTVAPTASPNAKVDSKKGTNSGNTLAQGNLSSVKNSKRRTIEIKWNEVKDAEGYQVQYTLNKKFKKKIKTKAVKALSITVKGLKKRKVYYVRVRAYASAGGKKVFGKWSSVKSVRIKK